MSGMRAVIVGAGSAGPAAVIHRDGRDGHPVSAHPMGGWYRRTFGAPFYGLHRAGLQQPGATRRWSRRGWGRCTISIWSSAWISPDSITRKYGPGRAANTKRLIQSACASQPWKVPHGIRGQDTSRITSGPTRQRSPIKAALPSMPSVVRFSPKTPLGSGWPSSASVFYRHTRRAARTSLPRSEQ